jgi:4,5-dihydroxyphthalate decarboxylase
VSLIAGEVTDPVIAGEVTIASPLPVSINVAPSVDQNSRMMLEGAHDVAEMSFATFLKALEQGRDLIGLPIFTGRGFLQPGVLVSAAARIACPADLAGKRVGIPQYWMTSSVWHRGILAQEGVAQHELTWCTASEERFAGAMYPPDVSIERLPAGATVNEALERGLVDAIMAPPRGVPKMLAPGTLRPYPDIAAAQRAYIAATGVFPIMHFVVMRASLLPELPELPAALIAAFT